MYNSKKKLKLVPNSEEDVKKYSSLVTQKTREIIYNELKETRKRDSKEFPEAKVVANFLYEKLYDKVTPPQKQRTIEDAEVIVESDKLRDLNPNHIIQIKMKIIEQGMEWHKMEDSEGNIVTKLTAE